KVRQRSESFKDHYSQAKLFWNSMTDVEKEHIIEAFHFEVGKVKSKDLQQQIVEMFSNVDLKLAEKIAEGVGVNPPTNKNESEVELTSPALSQEQNKIITPATRKVAVLAADGFKGSEMDQVMDAFKTAGIMAEIISTNRGMITSEEGQQLEVSQSFLTADSVLYDAVYVAGGKKSIEQLKAVKDAIYFVDEAYNHFKAIGAGTEAADILIQAGIPAGDPIAGVVTITADAEGKSTASFIEAIAQHRHWSRAL
uniref:catalase-related domain-containing protein n=1 Tax=Peribacillus sp. TaxID=2675267 RepID=UPI00388D6D02